MPIFGGAFSVGKPAKRVEDLFAVELTFLFAHAGNLAEFEDGAGLGLADEIECGVVENDEGGDHLLASRVSAPFAEEFAELFVDANGGIQFVSGGFEKTIRIPGWLGCSG